MDGNGPKDPTATAEVSAHQQQTRQLVGAMMKLTGLSASALASAAGLTPSTINRFMHRPVRHTLSQSTMLALMTETLLHLKNLNPEAVDLDALTILTPAIAIYERGILEYAPDVAPVIEMAKNTGNPGRKPSYLATHNVDDLPVLMGSSQGIDVNAANFY